MTTKKKKPEPNPIEEAIGKRANPPAKLTLKELQKGVKDLKKEAVAGTILVPLNPSVIPDEPTPSEMLTLEELNHETVERLQDQYPEEESQQKIANAREMRDHELKKPMIPPIPVLKLESQPVTKTCSPESPPQEIDKIDEYQDAEKQELGITKLSDVDLKKHIEQYNKTAEKIGISKITLAEDKELTALKKYIMGSGFVVTGVAYHIVALCSQPMTTPCTTTWDFTSRASIPEMVFTLLRKEGYLEGVWPSLKIIMGSNIGNDSWCAGVCTTIAFFDTIKVLPVLKELEQCSGTKIA